MNFVKVGRRFVNLDNVASVYLYENGHISIYYNCCDNDMNMPTEYLSQEDSAALLAIMEQVNATAWFAPAAEDTEGDEPPF
jgi:hypothetical protein